MEAKVFVFILQKHFEMLQSKLNCFHRFAWQGEEIENEEHRIDRKCFKFPLLFWYSEAHCGQKKNSANVSSLHLCPSMRYFKLSLNQASSLFACSLLKVRFIICERISKKREKPKG